MTRGGGVVGGRNMSVKTEREKESGGGVGGVERAKERAVQPQVKADR